MLSNSNILNFSQGSALCITSFIGGIQSAVESWQSLFGMITGRSERLAIQKDSKRDQDVAADQMYPMNTVVELNPETNHKLNPGGTHSV